MPTKVAKTVESIGGLSIFACALLARKAAKEEEAKQKASASHTAEHSQKYEEPRPGKVVKMRSNLVQNWLPEAPFWLSDASRNAPEAKADIRSGPTSSLEASGAGKKLTWRGPGAEKKLSRPFFSHKADEGGNAGGMRGARLLRIRQRPVLSI